MLCFPCYITNYWHCFRKITKRIYFWLLLFYEIDYLQKFRTAYWCKLFSKINVRANNAFSRKNHYHFVNSQFHRTIAIKTECVLYISYVYYNYISYKWKGYHKNYEFLYIKCKVLQKGLLELLSKSLMIMNIYTNT